MKKFLRIVVVWSFCSLILAQDAPSGQLEVFYQRVQGFDFFSGDPGFDIQDQNFNGGGFGFVFSLNDWLGFFSETGLYGGVEQGSLKMKLINQAQGVRVTAREVGPVNFYARGGIGFARYVFETPAFETVRYGMSLIYGGGVEIPLMEGLLLKLDGSRVTQSLPQITSVPDRDKWDSNFILTTGIAFQF